jgi:uncharacterized protein YciI
VDDQGLPRLRGGRSRGTPIRTELDCAHDETISTGKGAFEQPAVNDHAAFMNDLASEGVVLFAGPLAGSEHDRIRVLLIADADSETDIHQCLAADPWYAHSNW